MESPGGHYIYHDNLLDISIHQVALMQSRHAKYSAISKEIESEVF